MDARGRYDRHSPRQVRAARERESIFDALMVLAADRVPRITVAELTAQAHIAPNTLYRHFDGIEAAWNHMLHRGATEWRTAVERALSGPVTARARLFALAAGVLDFPRREPRWAALLAREAQRYDAPESEGVLLRQEFRAHLAELSDELGGPRAFRPLVEQRLDVSVGLIWSLAEGVAGLGDAAFDAHTGLLGELWLRTFR